MATVTKSNTITVNLAGYNTSYSDFNNFNTSYPATNAYNDSTSTTYAYVLAKTGSSTSSYISWTFADLSEIPSDATIGSVSCNVKYRVSSTNNISTVSVQLYSGSTEKGSATTTRNTTATAYALTCGTWTRSELDSLMLRVTMKRGTNQTTRTAGVYVYGADLTISYTWEEAAYTVTSTITGGTITSENPVEVEDGEDATITFTKSDDSYVLKSMTVNGTEVTPTWVEEQVIPGGNPTLTASTNTDEYSDSNGISAICDGDSSTYYWTQQTQAAGDYMMITLSESVYLTGVSSVCTESSTDYFKSNVELQISTDGTNWTTVGTCADSSSQSFTNINQICQYVRFYVKTASNYWWCVNEITLTYPTEEETIPGYYEYEISDISEDKSVVIVLGPNGPTLYRKINGTTWKEIKTIYQKTSSGWVEISTTEFQTLAEGKKFRQLEVPESAIGNVTSSTNAINITDDTLANDTYTLYYEDDDNNKLDDWDAIGTITKS